MDTPLLPIKHNKDNSFAVVRLHYSADPDRDAAWVADAKRGMPERGWQREYEIDYSIYEGKTFFPEFKEFNIQKSEYRPRETLYRGWDYGFHRPAVLITKLNQFDQWAWIDVILGEDEGVRAFGTRIKRHCDAMYPGAYYVDVGDPAGEQVSDKSEKTSVEILSAIGIYIRSRKQPIKQGAEIIRQKLGMRVDGKPGLIVNPELTIVIDGFKGGLHYPELREGQPPAEFYQKDGYYDHVFDGARYIATELFSVIGERQMANQITRSNDNDEYRMGRVEDPARNDLDELSHDIYSDSTNLGDYF